MKNQYFGDENDYKKYGLLNTLIGSGDLPTAVCWMLTPDDSGPDGRFTDYLSQRDKWRRYDPLLYDHLRTAVVTLERRDVRYAADVVRLNSMLVKQLPVELMVRVDFLRKVLM